MKISLAPIMSATNIVDPLIAVGNFYSTSITTIVHPSTATRDLAVVPSTSLSATLDPFGKAPSISGPMTSISFNTIVDY